VTFFPTAICPQLSALYQKNQALKMLYHFRRDIDQAATKPPAIAGLLLPPRPPHRDEQASPPASAPACRQKIQIRHRVGVIKEGVPGLQRAVSRAHLPAAGKARRTLVSDEEEKEEEEEEGTRTCRALVAAGALPFLRRGAHQQQLPDACGRRGGRVPAMPR